MSNQEEQIIIKDVVAGDKQAFATLVDTYKDMAVLLAYNILLDQQDAEEAAFDAFLKAYTSLCTFKAEARFSTWLYRIVINTALNKKKLKKIHPVEVTESMGEDASVIANSIDGKYINGENRKHIQLALKALKVNERVCLTLYYLNDLSVEEIHELTSISTTNIKVLLYRGRKNLYNVLHKHLKSEINDLI